MRRFLFPTMTTLVTAILFFSISVNASTQDEINDILTQNDAPFGVVFEIAEGNGSALQWAIPAVNNHIKQLRERFPDIGFAVVSHGSEQFGLMKDKQKDNTEMHKTVQSLVASDVPVHVCGTHASWKGKDEDDFPDYVDVAPAGPTEIRNYEEMGYVLVRVRKPKGL